MVRRRVAVITAALLPAALAAKAATTTIPIVFHIGSDPVKVGLVSNFKRPGGNLTGFTRLTVELTPKRLELLRELLPAAKHTAFLLNTNNPNAETITREARDAARKLKLELRLVTATTEAEIDAAFAALARDRPGGLLIGADAFFNSHSERIVALAAHHAIPTVYSVRRHAEAGGLISYGVIGDIERQVGTYVGRILKGEKPTDLPAQQATKVELILNLKTAKSLGLTVPNSLLGRADEVIE